MATTEERLQLERELREVTARLYSGAAVTYDERELLIAKQRELTQKKIELDPPAPEPSEDDALAAFERGEAWRKLDTEFREKQRDLQRVLTSSSSSPGEREAAEKGLRELKSPTYPAPSPAA